LVIAVEGLKFITGIQKLVVIGVRKSGRVYAVQGLFFHTVSQGNDIK